MTTILGYARVSTSDQDVAGQTMRLEQTGAIKVFTDVMSGKGMSRPSLAELLAYARQGDTLAIVRLDRLGPAPGRELLAAWLKYLENRSGSQPELADPMATYDFSWMWRELGIEKLRR